MKRMILLTLLLAAILLASCAPVDLNAPIPVYATGVEPKAWAVIPGGPFLAGQFNDPASLDYEYQMMITDVTVAQYVDYLNAALSDGSLRSEDDQLVGFYPGDIFRAVKHEVETLAANYIFVPLHDPASRFSFDGSVFSVVAGYENHPMTNVYCIIR